MLRAQSRIPWGVLSLFLGLTVFLSPARAEDEKALAIKEIQRAVTLVDEMSPWVDEIDLARLRLLRHRAEGVLDAIGRYGLAHNRTMLQYQHLIVTFRYSTAFFRLIDATEIDAMIHELQGIYENVVQERGFDDSPYTQIASDTFTQIHTLVLQLRAISDLPPGLAKELDDLAKPLGVVIAIAKQGDRPKTFEAALPLYHRLVALYPKLNEVEHSNAVFDIVLDIEGLNEFYAEYAQIDK